MVICLCVDYRELNKKPTKDAYPHSLPDEVPDQFTDVKVFSAVTGKCLSILTDHEQTAILQFCLCPGMGLQLADLEF